VLGVNHFFALYFFLKPPNKAPTAGLAATIPTFFSSGLSMSPAGGDVALG